MNTSTKVVKQEIQEELIGVLTAISIVTKRLARRLAQEDEKEQSNVTLLKSKNV